MKTIKKIHLIVSGLILSFALLILPPAISQTHENSREYRVALDEVNKLLMSFRQEGKCYGTHVVSSCGNKVCDLIKGENELNCPNDCDFAIMESYNSQIKCKKVKYVFDPSTVQGVQSLVKEARRKKLRVRVVGKAHTTNQQLCTDGFVIGTSKLNKIVGIKKQDGKEIVVVQPGVTFDQLSEWLHQRGKSLGYALTGFNGLSIGGTIATGAHGSSIRHSAVISSNVESLVIVNGAGEFQEFTSKHSDPEVFKALRTNLGMLGVVVEIGLKIFPQFRLDTKVTFESDYQLLGEAKGRSNLELAVSDCDFGQILWFPHKEKMVKFCGNETNLPAIKNAHYTLLNPQVPTFAITPYKLVLQYGSCYKNLNCLLEDLRYLTLKWIPPYEFTNSSGKAVATSRLVGYSHKMMASSLIQSRTGIFQSDWEIAVPMSEAPAALERIKKVVSQTKTCLPLVGIFIRFAPAEDLTLLAHTTAEGPFKSNDPVVLIEFPIYDPVGYPSETKEEYYRFYDQINRELVTEFSGRAHWGKNKEWLFQLQKKMGAYGDHWARFSNIATILDPDGVFSNEFSEGLGLSSGVNRPLQHTGAFY